MMEILVVLCVGLMQLRRGIVSINCHSFLFLQVAAVVFTEDLKRLYITMKEGFPLEYVVSLISLISYVFELEFLCSDFCQLHPPG